MKPSESSRPLSINRCPGRPRSIGAVAMALVCLLLFFGTQAMAREKPLDLLFKAADTDGNGLISETEWHAAMQKRLEAMDSNGDGNLSREEFEKARETAREKFRNHSPRSSDPVPRDESTGDNPDR